MSVPHSNEVVVIDKDARGRGARDFDSAVSVDACICSQNNIFLVLLVADCLPIVAYDKKKKCLGLFHAGWKSTEEKVASVGVQKMIDEFGCDPKDMIAALGPCIHKESYKFEDPAQKEMAGWEPFLEEDEDGKTMIDIVGYNAAQLRAAGIVEENIEISDIDTATDERFFSHYRDSRDDPEHEGRFACVIGLR